MNAFAWLQIGLFLVAIVAILLIVQGALEACMGLFLCVMGPVMMGILSSAPPPSSGGSGPPPALFGGIYIVMGLATLIGGVLKIVAGARNVKYRSRVLGFVAMGSGILSMLSFVNRQAINFQSRQHREDAWGKECFRCDV